MKDIWRLPAQELAGLIRAKKVSAREAATSALARLDAAEARGAAAHDLPVPAFGATSVMYFSRSASVNFWSVSPVTWL